MPRFTAEKNYISVSTEFISEYLPKANATFVKAYIYMLMLAQTNQERDFSEIATTLGILESDLMQAIDYWIKEGCLTESENEVIFDGANPVSSPEPEPFKTEDELLPAAHKTIANIADIITENKELSDLFALAQDIMGKTLTENDMSVVYWFYSDLGLPTPVILMLLEYCVSKGKTRMSYIEKIAVSWKEMGLDTPESAGLYMDSEKQKTGFLYSIRKIMGISDRSLSQIEEKYLTKWHEEFSMSEEMIALAYEYCIIQTAKLSFPYMDKIITRWNSDGITTLDAAEADNKKFKSRSRTKGTAFDDNSYDDDNLEMLTRARRTPKKPD